GAPPVEKVATKHADHEGDRKMHAHGVQGVAGDGDGGGYRLVRDLLDDGIVGLVTGLVHGAAPSVRISGRYRLWFRLPAPACLPLLAACSGPLSTLEPAGRSALGAARLWWIMLAGSAVLFLALLAVLLLALLRPQLLRTFGTGRT